jgi:hypothetical protein
MPYEPGARLGISFPATMPTLERFADRSDRWIAGMRTRFIIPLVWKIRNEVVSLNRLASPTHSFRHPAPGGTNRRIDLPNADNLIPAYSEHFAPVDTAQSVTYL